MNTISPVRSAQTAASAASPTLKTPAADANEAGVRQAFDSFVGQAFFGQMLQAMRKTVGKPAYFHGGRAEEMFQQQLDQVIGENLSKACGDQFSGAMYRLFAMQRR